MLVHPSVQIFVAMRQSRENYKFPSHLQCHFSDLTWLKQPRLGPRKHSRSTTRQKLPQWKLKVKKIQLRGSHKKPSVLETGAAKTHLAESSRGSVSGSRRPPVGVGSPCSYGWKDIWLTKSNPLQPLNSCFLKPLQTGEGQWVPQDVLKALLSAVS